MEKFDRIDLNSARSEPSNKWMVSLTLSSRTGFRDDFYFTFIFRIGWMSMVVDIFIRLDYSSSVFLHMRNIFLFFSITSIIHISGRWILSLFEFSLELETKMFLTSFDVWKFKEEPFSHKKSYWPWLCSFKDSSIFSLLKTFISH